MATQLVWFKRDLRVRDHAALTAAAAAGPVLALYVYEPSLIQADDFDACHLTFINECLVELRHNLEARGVPLVLRRGELPDVLEDLHHAARFETIWSHEETGNACTYERDKRVKDWSRHRNVTWHELPNHGVIRPLPNRDGWATHWQRRMRTPVREAPSRITGVELPSDPIQQAGDFDLPPSTKTDVQQGGESNALRVLASFLSERGVNYRADMSSPVSGWEGCSRISPYLAWGALSIRQAHHALELRRTQLKRRKANGQPIDKRWLPSLRSFAGRLRWHCHFMQKLEDEPSLEFRNINRSFDGLRENDFDEQKFQAWCQGRTGYPFVDACMRCLHTTGWINFRMRAMLMSFAAHHLWLHWRRPAVYLARQFLDYEPGIHYAQCQMQAGVTGINTVRIYAPTKQSIDQDPDGVFIHRWVPELRNIPAPDVHEPHKIPPLLQVSLGCVVGQDYPAPIVDHATAYQMARSRIYAIRRRPEARAEADRVYKKHGSRRRPRRHPSRT